MSLVHLLYFDKEKWILAMNR